MPEPATSGRSSTLAQSSLESWGGGVGRAAAAGALALPLVVVLRGPLGAGKSVLARAIARGAGVTSPMPSPTYNLLFSYRTPELVVHHLDLYRLDDPDDVWELGWEELGQGRELVLIEWPERAESLLPGDRWEVRLGFANGPAGAEGAAGAGGAGDAAGAQEPSGLRTVRVDAVGRVPAPPPVPGGGGTEGEAGMEGGRR